MWGNSSSYRRDGQKQTNTKQRIWKTVVAIKKVKVSCEAVSIVKYK